MKKCDERETKPHDTKSKVVEIANLAQYPLNLSSMRNPQMLKIGDFWEKYVLRFSVSNLLVSILILGNSQKDYGPSGSFEDHSFSESS